VALSLALLYHMAAILAGGLAVRPCSEIERRFAGYFKTYYDLTNQGYGYRYYGRLDATVDPHNPRPWATPVVIAELRFAKAAGGTSTETVRLPDRRCPGPRLRYQRQLDLAFHLSSDPRWAASYARHLCRTRHCEEVIIYTQDHQIPELAKVREAASGRAAEPLDLEADGTYTPRVKIGEFRCADF
jgi:hypothetical protein